MDCPNCAVPMRAANHGLLESKRCDGCRSAWHLLPKPSHLQLLEQGGTIAALTQPPKVLACPACAAPLIPISNNFRPELACRVCRACGGVLVDAPGCSIPDPFELKRLCLTLFLTLRSRV